MSGQVQNLLILKCYELSGTTVSEINSNDT